MLLFVKPTGLNVTTVL